MSRLLTGGPAVGIGVASDETVMRKKLNPTATDRHRIAAQTEAMRKSPADGGKGGAGDDDELLDGVVRTVTAQTDPRERRRARMFNRKNRNNINGK
jgi:hypothetical protein